MSGAFPLLRGLCVSCSGLDTNEKTDIHRRVAQLGGSVSSNLTTLVTHVVTKDTGLFCRKYLVSAKVGIPIVSLGFIRECESEARERNIDTGFPPDTHGDIADALRLITERNRFPPFTGCRVSSTGFAADVRTEIERLVESASMANSCLFSQRLAEDPSKHHSLGSGLVGGGGLYCGVLTANCTHLIARSPEGEKFKFAKSRSIPVVSLEWFIQCLRAGARQSEDEYTVDHGEQSVYTNGMAPAATNLRRLQSLDHAKQKTELVSSQASDSRGFCKHASAPLPKRAPSATSAQSGIPLTIEPVTGSGVSRQSGLVAPKALNRPRAVSSESGYADPCDLFPSSLAGVDSGEDSDVVCLVDRPAAPIPRLRPPQPPPPRAASAAFESCRIALSQHSLSLAKRHEWRSKIAAARGECISEDSLLPAHAIHDSSSGQWTHYIVDDSGELCDDDVRALQLAYATEMRPRPLVVRCGWLGECWRTGRRAKEASYSIPWPELCAEPNLGVVKSHGVPFAALEHLSATGSSTPTRQPTKPRPISLPTARQPLGDSVGIGSLAINSGGGTSKHAITTDSSAEDENSCQKSAKRPRRQPRGLSPSTASRGAAMDTHMTAASLQLRLVDGDSSSLRTELSTRSAPLAHLSSQARSTPQTTFTVATSDCSGGGGSAVFARCVFTSLGLPASAVVKFKGVVRENGGTFIDVFGSCPSATSPQPRARPQAPDPSIDWVLNTFATNIDGAAVTDAYVVIPLRGMDEMAACEVAVRRYPSIHIVTECWVDQCVHDSLRYPDYCAIQALRLPHPGLSAGQHIVFRPLKSTRIAGAESLSLSISGYEGTERDHISILAQALGIEFSQRLPRTTTHLICRRPFSGPKYERALKWGLQVVDSTWFYALVAAGNVSDIDTGDERQSIAVIGGPMAITNESDMVAARSTSAFPAKQMATPLTNPTRRSLLLGTPGRTPLDVSLERNIQQALGNNRARVRASLDEGGGGVDTDNDATQLSPTHAQSEALGAATSNDDGCLASVLNGAVVAISSRLLYRREELAKLAQQLGCRVLPRFDAKEATHLVHQSNRERETLRDYQLALQNGIHVVSPWWLYECRDTMTAVPEGGFPYTFNRDRRLMLVPSSQAPPKQQLAERLVANTSSGCEQISPSQGKPFGARGRREYSVHASATLVDTTNPRLLVLPELSSALTVDTHEIGGLFGKKTTGTPRRYRQAMDGAESDTSGGLEKGPQAQTSAISKILDPWNASSGQPQEPHLHSASVTLGCIEATPTSAEGTYLTQRCGVAETQTPDRWWLSVDPVASDRYAAEFQASMRSQYSPPDDDLALDNMPCTNAPVDDEDLSIELLGLHANAKSANARSADASENALASSPLTIHNTTIVYGEDAEAVSERDRLVRQLTKRET